MKQNPFSFSLSFLNTYNSPIFRKGRRKNSLSCTYLWQGLIFGFLSFTGEWHPQNRLNQRLSADFCPKILFYPFYGRLSPELAKLASISCQCLSRTKLSVPNFLQRKNGVFVYESIIWLFPSPTIPSGYDIRVTWISFFVEQITGHGVRVGLTFILLPF